jgi:urease accessory protein UreE
VLLKRAASVELTGTHVRKAASTAPTAAGRSIGVFLPRGSVVRGGRRAGGRGRLADTRARRAQPVLVVRHCTEHGSPFDLMRAAYHLGNRHVPMELQPDHLKIEPDHVLADMLRGMHLIVRPRPRVRARGRGLRRFRGAWPRPTATATAMTTVMTTVTKAAMNTRPQPHRPVASP